MTFKNVADLELYLKKEIQDCLEHGVAEEVKNAMTMRAKVDVYEVYPEPKEYPRRNTALDKSYYDSALLGDMKVVVKPNIPFNPYMTTNDEETGMGLERLITYGQGTGGNYGWKEPNDRPATYKQPRPWISNAREDLENSGSATAALAKGLQAKGINAK